MRRTARIRLSEPPALVELEPELAAEVVVQLEPDPAETTVWDAAVVELSAVESLLGRLNRKPPYHAYAAVDALRRATFPGVPVVHQYSVTVTPSCGGLSKERSINDISAGETTLLTMKVREWGRIRGRVTDEEGRPLSQAEVNVSVEWGKGRAIDRDFQWFVPVSAAGQFDLVGVGGRSVALEIVAEGYLSSVVELGELERGKICEIEPVVLGRGHFLEVELVGSDGSQLERGGIVIGRPDAQEMPVEDYKYSGSPLLIQGLPPGPFTVSAEASCRTEAGKWEPVYGRVVDVPPDTSVRIVLERGKRVEGVVVDESGEPIRRYSLDLSPKEGSLGRQFLHIDDPTGSFAADLPPGPWTLEVSGGGFGSCDVEVPTFSSLQVVVQRGVSYSGRVLDAGGAPIAGANVNAVQHRRQGRGALTRQYRSWTEADGSWSFDLPPGSVRFTASDGQKEVKSPRFDHEPGEVVEGIELVIPR